MIFSIGFRDPVILLICDNISKLINTNIENNVGVLTEYIRIYLEIRILLK